MSDKSYRNQRSSDVVSARARYSTSVLDRAITYCFLLRHEIKDVQVRNNTQWWSDDQ
jgi:hypothetical protein